MTNHICLVALIFLGGIITILPRACLAAIPTCFNSEDMYRSTTMIGLPERDQFIHDVMKRCIESAASEPLVPISDHVKQFADTIVASVASPNKPINDVWDAIHHLWSTNKSERIAMFAEMKKELAANKAIYPACEILTEGYYNRMSNVLHWTRESKFNEDVLHAMLKESSLDLAHFHSYWVMCRLAEQLDVLDRVLQKYN